MEVVWRAARIPRREHVGNTLQSPHRIEWKRHRRYSRQARRGLAEQPGRPAAGVRPAYLGSSGPIWPFCGEFFHRLAKVRVIMDHSRVSSSETPVLKNHAQNPTELSRKFRGSFAEVSGATQVRGRRAALPTRPRDLGEAARPRPPRHRHDTQQPGGTAAGARPAYLSESGLWRVESMKHRSRVSL